jgi:hypothetical protein
MVAKNKKRTWKLRAGDLVIVALVLAAAIGSTILVSQAHAGEKGSLAIVEVNGHEVRRVSMGDSQAARTFTVEGWQGSSTFEVKGGRVRMTKSACRDKICIGMGWMDTSGRSIICLPNRVVIRITGNRKSGGVDTVTE